MNKQWKPSLGEKIAIRTGARSSPLSKKQVEEVGKELQSTFPDISLDPFWVETKGDRDQKTSLRALDKTNFFTKEVDELVLSGECRIGIHSAKDLPEPLAEGLRIIAITEGVDPSDSLVIREGENFDALPAGARIATSSVRREEMVKTMRSDLTFIDLRGNIGQRLAKLEEGVADGVVIAEAALIRLGLTHLNRVKIPGETVPGQGKLAIVAREDDQAMRSLFSILDTRPTVLYPGLNQPPDDLAARYLHYPLIRIAPRDPEESQVREAFLNLPKATHVIFTSQSAIPLFFRMMNHFDLPASSLQGKTFVAVGKKTAACLQDLGYRAEIIPQDETAEGIIEALKSESLTSPHFFWPHSALSRPILREYFESCHYAYTETVVYDTLPNCPGPFPSEEAYDEILFTSPSTVDALLELLGEFPKGKTLKAIGRVTAKYLTGKCLV